jgi:hypothetical protein
MIKGLTQGLLKLRGNQRILQSLPTRTYYPSSMDMKVLDGFVDTGSADYKVTSRIDLYNRKIWKP